MAEYKAIKAVNLKKEGRELKADDKIELTVKRAEEIERDVEKVKPGYGPVLERLPEEKK